MAISRHRSWSCHDPLSLNMQNVSDISQGWGMWPDSWHSSRHWWKTWNWASGRMAIREGGTPSGPGDFFRAARARPRNSGTLGGATSGREGDCGIYCGALALQGLLRCGILCIFREGTGRVEGTGGERRVCLMRPYQTLDLLFAWRASCLTTSAKPDISTGGRRLLGSEVLTCFMVCSITSVRAQ